MASVQIAATKQRDLSGRLQAYKNRSAIIWEYAFTLDVLGAIL